MIVDELASLMDEYIGGLDFGAILEVIRDRMDTTELWLGKKKIGVA